MVTPLAAAISSTARRRLWPMDGGASNNTTPSSVVRKAEFVDAVGDPVQVPLDPPDVVALVVEGGARADPGDRRVVGQVGDAVGAVGR